ncbi:ABC transporter substrate-binding protein [Boudabousia liubingyangii]|uniref:ABC transporter substrate-binding protein n=1 Tax=Boudabousia liubingyangii TaxID=1921764 RepID=A0A1Q5PLK5_9ACTO|nr:ABC transporter substrate-binding protein [Boudabousia liubingyangii]OKL46963.1 ABC transporter substrate-binding protein [Boudabousia liubingyangii]OKL47929.1 ABC transporter substrate-binding protein [Boudabousia liubingyangii]
MRKLASRKKKIAAFAALALSLSACANTGLGVDGPTALEKQILPTIEPVHKGGTLTILDSAKDPGFDPARSQSLAVTSAGLVHRRLTTWQILPGQEPKVVPDLATDTGRVSPDGKTWEFTLKDDLKFEDGTPITSADIKYGLERSFAPTLSGGLGYHKTLLANTDGYKGPYEGAHLDSIETPDEKTIRFHLRIPYGDWPWITSLPAFAPVPKAKDNPEGYARAPIASGPYRIAEYRTGVFVQMERNPYWSNDDVRLAGPDHIKFSLGNDPVVSAQKLIYGQAQYEDTFSSSKVPAAQLITAAQSEVVGQRLQIPDPGPLLYLAINTKQVKDVHVRRAFNYAIDKSAVNKAAGGQLAGAIATTLITPGIPGREKFDLYPAPPTGDLDKAREELKQAQDVPKRPLVLITKNKNEDVLRAEAVARSISQLGLKVRIEPVESSVYSERTTQGPGDTYDMAIASWNPDFPAANSNIQPLYASSESGGGGSNRSRFEDPKIDEMISAASAELDPEKAKQMWAATDRAIMELAPSVPLVYQRFSYLRGRNVTNFYVGSFPSYPNYLIVGVKP